MLIEHIDGPKALLQAKADWDAVYAADPEATAFLSWEWINRWYKEVGTYWFVLAARPDAASDYVAFFPLQMRIEMWNEGGFYNEVKMGCSDFADYAGFLCQPAHQEEVIPAFAQYLLKMHWAKFHFNHITASGARTRLFMKAFERSRFVIEKAPRPMADGVDRNVCPHVPLPADWDVYLDTQLSTNTRAKARRFLKRIDESREFRITLSNKDTLTRDLEILFGFWKLRWEASKGSNIENIITGNRRMFMEAAQADMLFLPVLWHGDTPVARWRPCSTPRRNRCCF